MRIGREGSLLEHKRGYELTSHLSRISGQFLRISRRVYNAGGAVSRALPLIISNQPYQPGQSHSGRVPRRRLVKNGSAENMNESERMEENKKAGLTHDYLNK